ncbi:hypothetical protein GA0070616_0156 [Micromonospora nigra]|uniref:Uncharacterized protein n=1 Tax=Micromonospora nigra TaxID=145857 RepID=A0A1C6R8U3_9ACTN|nr:hypothetical protein [Micromonospora nigra]SCL13482.1 hypothetical protein GA0070616_0156 [Micromonospora nigra]
MSETAASRPSRTADRPDEVTDPLLWGLALDVADAHAPAEDGTCTHLLCAGQEWPCGPWNNAQRALMLARGGASRSSSTPQQQRPQSGPVLHGWTPAAEQSRRESRAA